MIENNRLSTKLLFEELKNARSSNSEILELDFDLESENDIPKILSIEKDENWGIFNFFFKVQNQDLFYIVNVEDDELNEVISGSYYNRYHIKLFVTCVVDIDDLISSFKIKPSFKSDYSYPVTVFIENSLRSTVGFEFDLKPGFLQNQLLEFLDIMDSDKNNFQKLLHENYGHLSIGIPDNDVVKDGIPLPIISTELIKKLSQYNLSIQFNRIIKDQE
ncbi:hypothetical protein [Chryseobacterium sp.]|uniref:hypothetical protein n=1 Tax=Chryseobacterium sp. TaxID=1871047 RepID=UPI0028A1305F|nr:hypothetical protein [Chryseobacterium sp.]